MRLVRAVGCVLMLVLVAACGSGGGAADPAADRAASEDLLVRYDLDGLGAVEIIDRLDRLAPEERPDELMASVRMEELVLSDETSELTLDLPADRAYLSIAPFVDQTHECFYHSLTTCLGEMASEPVRVEVVTDDGEVLVDDTMRTFDNGFLGLWLPRGVAGTVRVESGRRSGETGFATTDEAATCVTTLRLA